MRVEQKTHAGCDVSSGRPFTPRNELFLGQWIEERRIDGGLDEAKWAFNGCKRNEPRDGLARLAVLPHAVVVTRVRHAGVVQERK